MNAPQRSEGVTATQDLSKLGFRTSEVDAATWTPWLTRAANAGCVVGGRMRTVAGLGAAARLTLDHGLNDAASLRLVREELASIGRVPGSDPRGPTPMAIGAFFFDRGAPSTLVVPKHALVRTGDGRTWRVDVSSEGAPASTDLGALDATDGQSWAPVPPPDRTRPGHGAVSEHPPKDGYAHAVALVLKDIDEGLVEKVVLARAVVAHLASPPVPATILHELWAMRPGCSPFSVPLAAPDTSARIVGASPELVVGRTGATVTSHAFGGTASLSSGEASAAGHLISSAKERREHRLVVEAIAASLAPRCASLEVPGEPSVVRWPSDARLGTLVTGRLREGGVGPDTSLQLLAALHPTPAVCGVAREAALERIRALEELPRGAWAGTTGWTDGTGDGEWVLAIRSLVLRGSSVTIHAGAGVVEGSVPAEELAETTTKLAPILDVVERACATLV